MTQDTPDPLFSDSQPGKLDGIETEVITVGIDRRAPRTNPDECPMCGLVQCASKPLTSTQISLWWNATRAEPSTAERVERFVRLVEAAHNIKEHP